LNKEEHAKEQARQKDMVEGIVRGYLRQEGEKVPRRSTRDHLQWEKEKALERLNQSLDKLEKTAKDLVEITKALRNLF